MGYEKHGLLKVLIVSFAALGFMGCAPSADGVSLNTSLSNGSRSANAALYPSVSALPLKGIVYSDASNQTGFQQAVAGLVSTDMPESSLGYVSARWENNTGVAFGGRVELANGKGLQAAGTWSTNSITSSSWLKVAIAHSNQAQAGQPVLPFQKSSGFVQGNSATLRFSDTLGSIDMQGNFVNGRFQGQMSFVNYYRYDGSAGASGTLGNFDVAICDFFRC